MQELICNRIPLNKVCFQFTLGAIQKVHHSKNRNFSTIQRKDLFWIDIAQGVKVQMQLKIWNSLLFSACIPDVQNSVMVRFFWLELN